MSFMDHIESQEVIRALNRKMAAPLVTLLSKEPEIQYVALRNISLILQKRPNILQYEMKVFFCKYKDPIYVKMEKLELMIMLASERNIDQVLLEFKEYATAADVEFVRRAVRAIGRCAIKLENAAERCIHVLLDLIDNDFDPVIQESIIVIKVRVLLVFVFVCSLGGKRLTARRTSSASTPTGTRASLAGSART